MDSTIEAAADDVTRRYGWALLSRGELLARATERVEAGRAYGAAVAPHAAVLAAYSAAMHLACSGAEGGERQEQGYAELAALLERVARRRYADVAADAAQGALERVCRRFASCRKPEAFLAFGLQKLRDAARAELRWHCRSEAALPLDDSEGERPAAGSDPAEETLREEERRDVAARAAQFALAHPRAASQLAALWMRHVEDLDDQEIGRRLRRTAAAVQVLRSRGAARLRAEPLWRELALEQGLGGRAAGPGGVATQAR